MDRYKYNYKYINQWKILHFSNSVLLKKNLKNPLVILTFNFFDLRTKDFLTLIEAIFFIETITGQRPYLSKISINKKHFKSKINFKVQVHLRKIYASNWINLFKEFILTSIDENEALKVPFKVTNLGNFSFFLKDLSFFPGLEEESLYWNKSIKFDFILNSKNKYLSNFIIDQFGLINLNN